MNDDAAPAPTSAPVTPLASGRVRRRGPAPHCSFCGRGRGHYRALVEVAAASICDRCVNRSARLIDANPD